MISLPQAALSECCFSWKMPVESQTPHKASLLMYFSVTAINRSDQCNFFFWIWNKKGHKQFLLLKDKNDMNYGGTQNAEFCVFWDQTGINLGSKRNSWLFSEIVPRSSSLLLPTKPSMQIRRSKKYSSVLSESLCWEQQKQPQGNASAFLETGSYCSA